MFSLCHKFIGYKFFQHLVLIPFVLILVTGCDDSYSSSSSSQTEEEVSPLTPEELGYYQRFNSLRRETSRFTYTFLQQNSLISLDKELASSSSSSNKDSFESALEDLEEISEENLPHMENVLPPSSMEDFHNSWVALLKQQEISTSSDEFVEKSKNFKKLSDQFEAEFKKSASKYPNGDKSRVYFKPLFLPIGINLSTFELDFVLSVNTPVGNFSATSPPDDSSTVNQLLVEHQNKFRYIALAPGFEVFIPTYCGVKVKNANPKRLTIEVPKCESDAVVKESQPPKESETFEESRELRLPDKSDDIESTPIEPNYLVSIAKAHLQKNNNAAALKILDEAITKYPNDYETWKHHGVALLNLGKYYDSLLSFNKAIEINPDKFNAINNQGLAYQKLGRYQDALDSFDRAIRLDEVQNGRIKKIAITWNNRGFVLELMDRYNEALDSYDRALDIDPNFELAIENRNTLVDTMNR